MHLQWKIFTLHDGNNIGFDSMMILSPLSQRNATSKAQINANGLNKASMRSSSWLYGLHCNADATSKAQSNANGLKKKASMHSSSWLS